VDKKAESKRDNGRGERFNIIKRSLITSNKGEIQRNSYDQKYLM
jgi:hypothetical protein